MRKTASLLVLLALLITLGACDNKCDCVPVVITAPPPPDPPTPPEPVVWYSPMIAVEAYGDTNSVRLWKGEFGLFRNTSFEYVLRDADGTQSVITPDALIAGGALSATVRIAYDGDSERMVRIGAFAYSFFDHGRAYPIDAHLSEPNPPDVLVLWHNPVSGQWYNLIQDPVGRTETTLGEPNYFLLNRDTVEQIGELEVFVIPIAKPTRAEDHYRSGYVLKFAVELPDMDNHFHGREVWTTASIPIVVVKNADEDD